MMQTIRRGAAALALLAPGALLASDYSLGIGGELTRGDYGGSSEVTVMTVPLNLQYVQERYSWAVTVPYLLVTGPSDVVVTASGMGHGRNASSTSSRSSSRQRTDSGMGDVAVAGTWLVLDEGMHQPWVAVTGKVKFGTASTSQGLGTGENDYALQLELARRVLYGHAGYKWLGDPPGTDYHNIAYGAVGLNFPARGGRFGFELYGEEPALSGADGKRELSLYLARPLDQTRRINVYLLKGMSDASPDWGVGAMLRFML